MRACPSSRVVVSVLQVVPSWRRPLGSVDNVAVLEAVSGLLVIDKLTPEGSVPDPQVLAQELASLLKDCDGMIK